MAMAPPPEDQIGSTRRRRKKRPAREWPEALQREIDHLEEWALGNARDARFDSARFWALKIPAIVGSVSSGVFGYLQLELVSLLVGAGVAACVAIDAVNPGGKLRNAHLRAAHDLRRIEHEIETKWDAEVWKLDKVKEREELAATIIQWAEDESRKVANNLREAETALGEPQAG